MSGIFSTASIIWRRRTLSGGCKLRFRLAHYVVAEVAAQVLRGARVDRVAGEQRRQLDLDFGHIEEARRSVRLNLDQKVEVAVGAGRPFEAGAKERQLAGSMPTADSGENPWVNRQAVGHDTSSSKRAQARE